jgi:hypothetical protein
MLVCLSVGFLSISLSLALSFRLFVIAKMKLQKDERQVFVLAAVHRRAYCDLQP